MKKFFKNKTATIAIIVATIMLAGVAIFTALRLYQLRQESLAPESSQAATPNACTGLTFNISTPTPTPEGTATLTPTGTTATATPTSTPTPSPTGTVTTTVTPTGTTTTSTATPTGTTTTLTGTATPTGTVTTSTGTGTPSDSLAQTPTTEEKLPDTGVNLPTIMGISIGTLLLVGSLLLLL